MTDREFRWPRFIRLLLSLFADDEMLISAEEDLAEQYAVASARHGIFQARLRSSGQMVSMLLSFIIEEIIWRFTMFRNYLKVALRHIRRRKVYSFIKIMGLVVGMSSFILIGLWVKDEMSYDRFHRNKDRIFRILNRFQDGGGEFNITYALGPALKDQYPEVEEFSRVLIQDGALVRYQDKDFDFETVCLADPGFFKVFSFPLIKGDPETVQTDRYSVVLTEETAVKYFGNEDPLGKVLNLAQMAGDFTVTGVIADIPLNSTIQFDFVARIEFLGEDRLARWREWTGPTFVLLRPDISPQEFEAKIAGIYKENIGPAETYVPTLQPLTRIHLYELGRPGQMREVAIFSVIAIFILLMACINFMNLATAQSAKRSLEVGMRKVIGALRRQIIRQFLWEAVLIAWPAAYLVMSKWLQEFAYRVKIGPAVFVLSACLALVVALAAVSYHSLKAALSNPVDSLRYE